MVLYNCFMVWVLCGLCTSFVAQRYEPIRELIEVATLVIVVFLWPVGVSVMVREHGADIVIFLNKKLW